MAVAGRAAGAGMEAPTAFRRTPPVADCAESCEMGDIWLGEYGPGVVASWVDVTLAILGVLTG